MRARNILAALAALAAITATPVSGAEDDLGIYVGVALGRSDMRQACEGVAISCEDTDVGWKVIAGVAHYHGFNLELAYARLGEAKASGAGARATKRISVWEISVLKDFRLGSRFGVFPKAGLYHYDVDVRASGPVANFAAKERLGSGGFAGTLGAGVRFNVSRTVAVRAEWQRYFDAGANPSSTVDGVSTHVGKTDVDFASLALLYMF